MAATPEIRLLHADEAPRLVDCIRRCYGDSYIDPEQYDVDGIAEAIATGRRVSIVALTPEGAVVGHMSLTWRRPEDNTADAGMTLVDPEHRGQGIAHAVGLELGRQAMARGLVGAHDYPVTVHGATQRIGAGIGVETGLLLDNLPADVRFEAMGNTGGQASASMTRYLPMGAAPPRAVQRPEPYAAILQELEGKARCERSLARSDELRGTEADGIACLHDERRGVLRVVAAGATPAPDAIVAATRRAAETPHAALQVDLPLGARTSPDAVSALRSEGFFYGGWLPEFREGDVLRLQRLPRPPTDRTAPALENPEGRAIADFVLSDAREVSGR